MTKACEVKEPYCDTNVIALCQRCFKWMCKYCSMNEVCEPCYGELQSELENAIELHRQCR